MKSKHATRLHSSNTIPIDELSPLSISASSPASSLIERTFSPIMSSTPTPTRTASFSYVPSPTAHITYETFSTSSSTLSVRSLDKRNSISQEFTSNQVILIFHFLHPPLSTIKSPA